MGRTRVRRISILELKSYRTNNTDRLRRKHKVELEGLPNDDARAARVAELNVQQSIEVLKQHPAIKRAVVERGLSLHGLIYDIGAGQLKILEEVGGRKMNGH